MNLVEARLRDELHRQADGVPVGDGWQAIHRRIARRQRSRQMQRGAATVAAVAVLCAGAVTLAGRAGDGRVVSNPAAQPEAGQLPRLVLGLPDLELRSASSHDAANDKLPSAVKPDLAVKPPTTRLYLLGKWAEGLDGPVLFVRTTAGPEVPAPRPNPLGTPVAVGNATGTLQELSGLPTRSLTWQAESGAVVHMTSARLTADELVAAGRAVVVDSDGGIRWQGGMPPARLEMMRGATPTYDARAEAEIEYTWQGDRMTVRLQAGGIDVVDDLTADRMAGAAQMTEVSVGGQTAAWITQADGSLSVIWEIRPGVVAELVAEGVAREQAQAAVASVHEVSSKEWDALLKRSLALAKGGLVADPVDSVLPEVCRLRTSWLSGNALSRAEAIATMEELQRKATSAGWGKTGDILVVIQRLLDAMRAGDAATVAATPAGGCP